MGRLTVIPTFRATQIERIGTPATAIVMTINDMASGLIEDITASEGTTNLEIQHVGEAEARNYTETENVHETCTVDNQTSGLFDITTWSRRCGDSEAWESGIA